MPNLNTKKISIPSSKHSEKSRKKARGSLHFRVKIFAGLFFVFWIGFLFLETKYGISKQTSSYMKPEQSSLVASEQNSLDAQHTGTEQKAIPQGMSGFLEEGLQTGRLENIDTLGSLSEKIVLLEKLQLQDSDPKIKRLLLDAYQLDHQYLKARKLFYALSDGEKKILPKNSEFLIFLQSFTQGSATEYQHLKDLFDFAVKSGSLSGEQVLYYQSAFEIADGNYKKAKNLISSMEDPQYADYKKSITTAFNQYENLQGVPSYYQNGLLALQLLNHGFYGLAKKIALPLVSEYPNYILPYQVLANADFELGRTESALSYFQQLLKLDYQQKNTYLYHLGVLSYQLENYAQAVIFFSQITDGNVSLDADRYLVLSYLALGEERKALRSWQRLVEYSQLKKSDFYTFFQAAFWNDYRQGQPSSYLQKDPKLVEAYLNKCQKILKKSDQIVCEYGKIGYDLHSGKNKVEYLRQIRMWMREYQHAEFYQILGEIMLEKGHLAQAQEYFMQALKLATSQAEKSHLKSLILKTAEA